MSAPQRDRWTLMEKWLATHTVPPSSEPPSSEPLMSQPAPQPPLAAPMPGLYRLVDAPAACKIAYAKFLLKRVVGFPEPKDVMVAKADDKQAVEALLAHFFESIDAYNSAVADQYDLTVEQSCALGDNCGIFEESVINRLQNYEEEGDQWLLQSVPAAPRPLILIDFSHLEGTLDDTRKGGRLAHLPGARALHAGWGVPGDTTSVRETIERRHRVRPAALSRLMARSEKTDGSWGGSAGRGMTPLATANCGAYFYSGLPHTAQARRPQHAEMRHKHQKYQAAAAAQAAAQVSGVACAPSTPSTMAAGSSASGSASGSASASASHGAGACLRRSARCASASARAEPPSTLFTAASAKALYKSNRAGYGRTSPRSVAVYVGVVGRRSVCGCGLNWGGAGG